MPKQRIGWEDYKTDYEEFSSKVSDEHFPRGQAWLMVGPTGPRRLRLAIEISPIFPRQPLLFRRSRPRWVKNDLRQEFETGPRLHGPRRGPAVTILKHRKISALCTTPKLLEALGEKLNLYEAGIPGVFCGGTTMARSMCVSFARKSWKAGSVSIPLTAIP